MKRSTLTLLLSCAMFSVASQATPVQLSSFANYPADTEVNGFHGSLFNSKTGTVNGFDLPILGYSELDQLNGFQLGVAAGSYIHDGMNGVALGLFNWHGGNDSGVNLGIANSVGNLYGVNLGLYSAAQAVQGVNLGAVTQSGDVDGEIGRAHV